MSTKIKLSILNQIIDNLQCDDRYSLREEYSGRGMYGKTCIGISFSCTIQEACYSINSAIQAQIDGHAEYDWSDEVASDMNSFLERFTRQSSTDSLGLDTILYNRSFVVDDDVNTSESPHYSMNNVGERVMVTLDKLCLDDKAQIIKTLALSNHVELKSASRYSNDDGRLVMTEYEEEITIDFHKSYMITVVTLFSMLRFVEVN